MKQLLICLFTLVTTIPFSGATLDDLGWIAGKWATRTETASSEEVWTEPAGAIMLGMHRDIRKDGKAFFEFLRIEERDGEIAFIAQPGGQAPTSFPMASFEDGKVVFENPEHDFPQRIIYWLDGEKLCARAEAIAEPGKGPQWCWSKE